MKLLYALANTLFHALHLCTIAFVMFAWLYPPLLPAHLILSSLTLASWFLLGYFLGIGYCPISDWHWKIKAAIGGGRPAGTYIHHVLQQVTSKTLDSARVDRIVVIVTIVLTVISAIANAYFFFTRENSY